jgi:ferredoxin
MPSYEMSTDEVRSRASKSCPPSFIALTLSCIDVNPLKRPLIRDILSKLQIIEDELIQAEVYSGVTYSVGSISFAGSSRITGKNRDKKNGLRKVPSFEGRVQVGHRRGGEEEDDEDDIDLAMLELEDMEIGDDKENTAGGFYRRIDLDDIPSTRLRTGSTTFGRSSIMTLKGFESIPHLRSRSSLGSLSLPPIPSAWIHPVDSAFEPPSLPAITANNDSIISRRAEDGHYVITPDIFTSKEAGKDTASILEGDGGDEIFHSAILVPLSTPSTLSTLSNPSPPLLHRFSLIKPAWFVLTLKTLEFATGYNINDGNRTPQAIVAGTKCDLCEKTMGRLRAFLQCDDCFYRCHLKCSDRAPILCHSSDSHLFTSTNDVTPATKASLSTGSRIASKLLRRSKVI